LNGSAETFPLFVVASVEPTVLENIHGGKQSMADVEPYLQKIVDQLGKPQVQTSLKGFTRVILFRFTDTREDWLIRTVDGKEASLEKASLANPDLVVTTTTEVLTGVMDRRINGMAAYMGRKIQVKGSMDDLMRLQKLLF
jgi:putative sterol carrier protein